MALISCKECGSEVSSKAETCPKCGVRVLAEPIGCGMTIGVVVASVIIIPVILSVLVSGTGDGAPSLAGKSSPTLNRARESVHSQVGRANISAIEQLDNSPPSGLSPDGELAEMFSFGSDFTDLQRELKLKEIQGKVVQWHLPIYEVSKRGDGYTIQTDSQFRNNLSEGRVIGTFLRVTPRSDLDREYIQRLKTGDIITIKGVIRDSTMRNLEISPAFLIYPMKNRE